VRVPPVLSRQIGRTEKLILGEKYAWIKKALNVEII
jgi:hypothetical protein